MKTVSTLLLLLVSIATYATPNKVYDKLCEVNKCWQEQTDLSNIQYPEYANKSDREWIRTHLQLVETVLRSRSTAHLGASQKKNRLNTLNRLNEYWHGGSFPINDEYAYRTPIFIDKYDNFCAVGYLVKATGHEDVSRMIASKTNLAYVREMNYPELFAWADEYGFTVDELAWIQPSYPWPYEANEIPIGKGTDGVVYKLFNYGIGVVVAGNFNMVDGNMSANNIALFYPTVNGGLWDKDSIGGGVDGTVYALSTHKGELVIGGAFNIPGKSSSNIAIWNGASINSMGCINGTVYDLIEHGGDVYAVGDFDVCAALAEVNFAKWNDSNQLWQQIPGLEGHVNTIMAISGTFYLGGNFKYQNDSLHIIKWTEKNGFEKFDKDVEKEVTDIVYYKNQLFASAKNANKNTLDCLLYSLQNNEWNEYLHTYFFDTTNGLQPSYNALAVDNDIMYVGGHFLASTGQDALHNSFSIDGRAIPDVNTDGSIHDILVYKNQVFFGGDFKYDHTGKKTLNSICTRTIERVSVPIVKNNTVAQFSIHPNPANYAITVENNFGATEMRLYNLNGQLITTQKIRTQKQNIYVPDLSAGIYIVELRNKDGLSATERLTVN
ncbi:MAG: T9SS type A sorting domain-containing protein [Chitinophagales bacterium]|nr:T9SS type A sorting domain-containing protein [Chitinophagaceae bacterium]MCB9065185.1 T9SS type A sorting domain-containing protein [Chitinophagales bacterium]